MTEALGAKVRALRLQAGSTQKALAAELGISASYLNLIEHGRRSLSAPVLIKVAQLFRVDLDEFAADDHAHALAALTEAFNDPAFDGAEPSAADIRELALSAPSAARAVLELYRAYKSAQESAETLAGRVSEGMALPETQQWRLPSEEVSDFIQRHQNHFPALEEAAEELWHHADLNSADLYHGLERHLHTALGIQVQVTQATTADRAVRRLDTARKTLELSESLPLGSRVFQLAHQICLLTQSDCLTELSRDDGLTADESRALCRVAMANYFAGAVLMPYSTFTDAAHEERYDIDLLGNRFGANFEQVCHRFTTLGRPGAEGVPFHFVRVDVAGNVSKRFSASGIQLSRFGACPRWGLHAAFLTPGRIITQLERMPSGETYFCVARTVAREARGYHVPRVVHAITLGCAIERARELVYADGVDLGNLDAAVPIGTTCRLCDRLDCEQRAFPSLRHPLSINENARGISFYAPV